MSADDFVATFEKMKTVASELERNLNHLELDLSDATKFIYDHDNNLKSGGVDILNEILKQFDKISNELEEIVRNENTELEQLSQEVEEIKETIDGYESKQLEMEKFLVEQNMIYLENSNLSLYPLPASAFYHNTAVRDKSNEQNLNANGKHEFVSPQSSTSDNTFLIPSVFKTTYVSQSPDSEFQNTIYDFGSMKKTPKDLRKTYLIRQ